MKLHKSKLGNSTIHTIVWICMPRETYMRVDDKRMLRGHKICFDFDNAGLGSGVWGFGVAFWMPSANGLT